MNRIMEEKLEEIADRETITEDKRVSLEDIQEVEKKYNIALPPEYKEFLTNLCEVYVKEGYGFPLVEAASLTPQSGYETMDYFYAASFEDNIKSFFKNCRNDMAPIGEAGGDSICIGIEGDKYGKIYYVYHEDESHENAYLIAQNFQEFIFSFEPIKEENEIDLSKIKMELDDDLWND